MLVVLTLNFFLFEPKFVLVFRLTRLSSSRRLAGMTADLACQMSSCLCQDYNHGRTGRGGGGGASPPSLLGKQSQSGNIRSTVGQYWLIIKKNGTNSVNFVGNFVISGKVVGCFKKFRYVRKLFGPLKWYTDRNFFGDGGGGEGGRQN